jgi:hypothetical protein
MPLRAQGEFAQVDQNMQVARRTSGQPVKRGTMAHDHDLYMVLTDNAMQLRDIEGLRQYAPLLEELAHRDGHSLYQAIAHRAFGVAHRLAAQFPEADRRLKQAVEIFEGLETRWQLGRTFFELGELAKASSEEDRAGELYRAAFQAFESMQANPDAARARSAMEALSV